MDRILNFSTMEYVGTQKGMDIVDSAIALCKEAIACYSKGVAKSADYNERNKVVKEAMVAYATERCPYIDETVIDTKTEEGFRKAFASYSAFREMFFSVIQETLAKVNSKIEIQQMLAFAEVRSGAEGDSENFLLTPNNIIEFEGIGYSSNATRHNFYLSDNATILPERKEASVAVDLYQFNAGFFDFGQMLADLAIGMRLSLQKEVATKVFDTTDLTGTPFLVPTFAKPTFMELNEKISTINGSTSVAYGTKLAFGKITDGLDAKYFYGGLGERVLANGHIDNVFGTRGIVLDQAVDITSTQYDFALPSDKLLIASANDKLIKVFMEGNVYIQEDDGRNNPIMQKSYKVMTSWGSKKITNSVYGIQLLA